MGGGDATTAGGGQTKWNKGDLFFDLIEESTSSSDWFHLFNLSPLWVGINRDLWIYNKLNWFVFFYRLQLD